MRRALEFRHGYADYDEERIYDEPEIKALADMQILDFICMNGSRSERDMTYQFEGLENGNTRFVGVQGLCGGA